ncbi:MAG TPA: MG2 domain-containing protein, partial [Cyclobacteriaceae bacterium]|nr:MG2 domain-containing protein [Cyclobacteriaceae bacterium]
DANSLGETTIKLFDFSPGISGKTVWLDSRTIEFQPAARLQSGQVYEVEFGLSKLVGDVPGDLSTFKYSFQVIPQNFELTVDNIRPYVKTELKRQKIEGALLTADYAESDAVEKSLSAQQGGRLLSIQWSHTGEGKHHGFTIEDVLRNDKPDQVTLTATGTSLGIEQNETREVEIPALGDFKVVNVKVEQGGTQHVIVQFSDPLNEKQNLSGLLRISDIQSLDFEIKDNEVHVFPPVRQTGSKKLSIEAGVRNVLNYKMGEGSEFDVLFEQVKPAVRFIGRGNILPSTDGLVLPFEAVSLKAVDIQIIKIFETNVLQFLQVNEFDGNQELRRVGRPLIKKMVSLENSGVSDLSKWNRFTLDLAQYIKAEPGAIYQVRVSFKKAYSAYDCSGEESGSETTTGLEEQDDWSQAEGEDSNWDYYQEYYYEGEYQWEQRDNPCNGSYYNNSRSVTRNVIASDLGLMAKRGGDGNTVVFVNDLKTTKPLSGVLIELYDFQQEVIGSATTDGDGKTVISARQNPFALIAKSGTQRGYIKLQDGESLSLSNFDVGGEQVSNGLKGFLYGERGVWRPGDSLYLSFLLEDKMKLLPAAHPVVMELQNPQGQITTRLVRSASESGFYKFATATTEDAPTGNWTARVKVGAAQFSQTVKIETIKPNRLKINLDFGKDKITAENNNVSGTLNVKWLYGAPGRNLKAEFEVLLTKGETKFAQYPEYIFDDPGKDVTSEVKNIFEGYTDDDGNASVNTSLEVSDSPPGVLNAVFRGKVFEESGNFSIDRFSLPFYPFASFTGIRLPQGDKARGMLLTDTTHRVDVVTLDADGKGVSRNEVHMTISKLSWRWWWDNAEDNANYMSGTNNEPIASGVISTINGKGSWNFKVKYPEWGRFLVRATDPVSGHSTAKVVYIDWPGWAGRARNESAGATMLSFSSDKPAYNIGEKAILVIPGSEQGRALISVENGSRVIETHWLETQPGDNRFSFEIKPEMTPNVFVSVTLLQPYAQTLNDLPIRMYGVIPISVEDPQTHLTPVISMPDELEPGQEVTIKISEKSKRKMAYTVAIVEEGLLDITRYRTPDPWNRFYSREALGVKTWDIYDAVMGAFGGKIERLLAIGGDMEAKSKEDDAKSNRFKPVVKFLGPFTLDGGTNEHKFTMPQYIGSVKTMVVAGYEGAYGSVDKATPVRKPLMVLATLPRVLGPEENVKLPITLFRMDKNIRNVKVELKTSGPVTLVGESSRTVTMDTDDVTSDFDLAVKSETGIAKIEVTVSSGSNKASDVIEIEIRNPNPSVTKVTEALLEPGKSWSSNVVPVGVTGSNTGILEVSSLPPINLGQRLKYLMQYPYGCIEQTTSSVFPQLYLDLVKNLTTEEKALTQKNVRAGIERLKLFVTSDGGFAYWPGNQDSDSWGSTYAGHFLLEAEAKGYFVPNEMLKRWKKYQKAKSTEWRKNKEYQSSELIQAYRLYTLALAGNADLASMNRLREMGNLPVTSAWMLASAYVKAGQPEAAKTLIANLPVNVKPYQEMAYSYGDDTRDKAIILEALLLTNDRTKGFELVKDISASLSNSNNWMSTQSIAWSLKAVGMFAGTGKKEPLKFNYSYNGKDVPASTDLTLAQIALPMEDLKSNTLKIESQSQGALFVRVITEGIPARGQEEAAANNLGITINYTDKDGAGIDPTSLEQGQEFIASVSITNPGARGAYKNLAINQIFPSGWEINNLRLDEAEDRLKSDKATYQDIRDDHVYTYFDIGPNQRKTFKVMLTASYAGKYYLPSVSCEAMYDHSIYARTKGQVVEVTKRVVQ